LAFKISTDAQESIEEDHKYALEMCAFIEINITTDLTLVYIFINLSFMLLEIKFGTKQQGQPTADPIC
jgi:hypothetical protein